MLGEHSVQWHLHEPGGVPGDSAPRQQPRERVQRHGLDDLGLRRGGSERTPWPPPGEVVARTMADEVAARTMAGEVAAPEMAGLLRRNGRCWPPAARKMLAAREMLARSRAGDEDEVARGR